MSFRKQSFSRLRREMLEKMTPERRAQYERIKELYDKSERLQFDVVAELRKIRGGE